MKKSLKFSLAIVAFLAIVLFAGKVNAAKTPELQNLGGKEYFFANGTPITIEERTDNVEGAKISWKGGTQLVSKNTNIFGGMHDDNTEVDTSITMTGGTVRNIIGGGLHLSNTNSSKIYMNGGSAIGIIGGGTSSFVKNCGCTNGTTWYAGDPKNSPCQTKNARIELQGGKVLTSVFGGGEGISNTETATIQTGKVDLSTAYVIAGGSNGRTGTAGLLLGSTKIKVAQGINRGTIDSIYISVDGAEIENLYVGGDTTDSDVDGTISRGATVYISELSKIKELSLGTNGGNAIDVNTGVIKASDIEIYGDSVKNIEKIKSSVNHFDFYKVNVKTNEGGEIIGLEEGKAIATGIYQFKVKLKDGYKLKSVKILDSQDKAIDFDYIEEEKEYSFSMPKSDVTVYAEFEKIETKIDEGSKEEIKKEKDDTPKTGIDIIMYAAMGICVISLAGIAVKKYSK